MSNTERIIENVDATMNMEGMPLLQEDKERGKVSFEYAVNLLINKYTRRQVN